MTDISESGIEAAVRAGDFSVDSKTKAKMRRMLKAYLPFHREEGLRDERDDIIIAWLRQRGFIALADEAEKTFQPAALIPTKPEAGENGFPWKISSDAWRQVVERIVREAERVYGPGPVVDAVRAALQSKKPE